MSTTSDTTPATRLPLSRERVLRAAVDLADREGVGALTMRRLASELDVEAMSLYHHVANKGAVLDGIVDVVVGEATEATAALADPTGPDDWQATMRERVLAARRVLVRHPWAPPVIESRTGITPAIVVYMDQFLGIMRAGGFSWDLAHHAVHALGSRALGFTQELFAPDDAADDDVDADMLEQMAALAPNIVEMVSVVSHDADEDSLGWCDDQSEFEFGLDVFLDGLEMRRRVESG